MSERTTDLRVARRLVRDDDGHWYLIPASEEERFHRWVAATQDGAGADADEDWAFFNDKCRIDSPGHIEIYEWKVT